MRPYAVDFWSWLKDLPDTMLFIGLLWVFAVSLACHMFSVPVREMIERIINAITGGM